MPDGSIVLMGGKNGGTYKNDVWRSTDNGATWAQMKPDDLTGWSARASHSSVVMPDGSIVLMGGENGGTYKNDVWKSTDNGATWAQMKPDDLIGWSARASHSSVAMPDGRIVLTGGENGGTYKNDVWRSNDNSATWVQMNASAGWSARASHSSVVVRVPDTGVILMGGQDAGGYKNDVWFSDPGSNGGTWTLLTANADWSARSGQACVSMPDGSNVLFLKPQLFHNLPNIGPISEVDIKVTFDTTPPGAVRGLDNYDPLSQREDPGYL